VKWVDLKDSEKLQAEGLEYSSLTVRLAMTPKEKDEVFRLRYEIFNEELGEGIPENVSIKRDIDRFDPYCDHLMVEKDSQLVGCYRMLPGKRAVDAGGFYSETEFNMRNLPIDFSEAAEMGRACVRTDYRKQSTLAALMCGIRHYLNLMDCQYLFGLASLPKMSHENALATFEEVKKLGRVLTIPGVGPLKEMEIPAGTGIGTQPQIPALLSVYFNIGAHVCAKPSYDPIFQCHDLLTMLKYEEIPERTWNFFEKFAKRSERDENSYRS
jgi:putative hemolysin